MDLHKAQIQGFFDIPVDHLFAAPVIIDYLARQRFPNLTIVVARRRRRRTRAGLRQAARRRTGGDRQAPAQETGTAEVMNVIGDVEGRTCILQDDIIDTAGTIQKAAHALKANGAERVLACAVHGVLSGPAIERIEKSPIEKLIVTNTIPLDDEARAVPRRSWCCRWRGCWRRRSAASTRRRRCRRCSCSDESENAGSADAPQSARRGDLRRTRESWKQHSKQSTRGHGSARTRRGRLRATGRLPAVVYGGATSGGKPEAMPIAVDPKALMRILHSESGANTLITLKLDGEAPRVLLKEFQLDPVTHHLLHADFYRVAMDKTITVTVPIVLQGRGEGRQAAGRHPRLRAPRDRDRVPAGRHPRAHRGRRDRADAEPGHPRARRHRAAEVDAGQRARHDARPRRGRRRPRPSRRPPRPTAAAAPAEPEVIKKGKAEKEGDEKARSRPESAKEPALRSTA